MLLVTRVNPVLWKVIEALHFRKLSLSQPITEAPIPPCLPIITNHLWLHGLTWYSFNTRHLFSQTFSATFCSPWLSYTEIIVSTNQCDKCCRVRAFLLCEGTQIQKPDYFSWNLLFCPHRCLMLFLDRVTLNVNGWKAVGIGKCISVATLLACWPACKVERWRKMCPVATLCPGLVTKFCSLNGALRHTIEGAKFCEEVKHAYKND